MSASKVFGAIILIAGIILFFANVGTVIDVAGDVINGISNNNNGSTITINDTNATKAKAISSAIEPRNSTVRSLALNAISNNSDGEYNIGQICDIFDYLYNNWTYVSDPGDSDYYAKASESAKLMKGDCDDFAILMASCIEAIGGTTRYNSARNSNNIGHAFTEVYVTDNLSDMKTICNQVSKRYGGKTIHWREYPKSNGKTEYWLNLDWSENHPGGEYFNSVGTILAIKSDGNYYTYTTTS